MNIIAQLTNYRLLIIITLLAYVFSNAKKISFLDKLKTKSPEQYIKYLKSTSIVSQVDFKFVQKTSFDKPIMKLSYNSKVDVSNKNKYVLYEISKKNVLNIEWILYFKRDLFNKVFSKIHSQENTLALLLIHLIHTDSQFSLYLKNLPSESPLIYDYYYLQLLNETPIFEKIEIQIKELKRDYKDIRGLIFSYGETLKNKNFGAFLFGDFIWAYSIVKNYSIKKDDNLHLVPGIENINVFGIELPNTSISENYNFSCVYNVELKYIPNNEDPTYQIILNVAPEEIYELLEKYPYAINCEIPYNFDNDELFLVYGRTLQAKEFDFAVFSYEVLFGNLSNQDLKQKLLSKNKERLKEKITISCNENHIQTFEYQISLLSQEHASEENQDRLYLDFYKNFLLHVFNLSKKISKIKTVIENKETDKLQIEPVKEIENILNYLLNRQKLYEEVFTCLEKSFKKAIKSFVRKESNIIDKKSDDAKHAKEEL